MNRQSLEQMSNDELQHEAQRLHLKVAHSRDALIDGIMSHMERRNSGTDAFVFAEPDETATGVQSGSSSNMPQQIPSVNLRSRVNQENPPKVSTEEMLARMMAVMTQGMQQQQQFMATHQAAMQQQQNVLLQLIEKIDRGSQSASGSTGEGSPTASTHITPIVAQPTEEAGTGQPDPSPRLIPPSVSPNVASLLSAQIPEFGGSDQENVHLWVQRVNQIARVHRVPDNIILLTASSKLVNEAKRWYDFQIGIVLESWDCLSEHLIKMFVKRVSFSVTMQKIEARKWLHHKETFDQYAIDKLSLLHRLNLPCEDVINLLIGGITISSLNATALTLAVDSVEQFLAKMRKVTQNVVQYEKDSHSASKLPVNKIIRCNICNKNIASAYS